VARRIIRWRYLALALALGASLVGVTSSAAATGPSLVISASPALFPAFRPLSLDYVVRCTASPVTVSVTAPLGTTISVDDQPSGTGQFSTSVTLAPGQEFSIVSTMGQHTRTYFVRCLPTNFPRFKLLAKTSTTAPQAQWYVVTPLTPGLVTGAPPGQQYLIFLNKAGAPVYWLPTTETAPNGSVITSDFGTYLGNGDVAWTHHPNWPGEERNLDGGLVRWIGAGGTGQIDLHDLVLLPDSDYLVGILTQRKGVDLSSWGGTATTLTSTTILDQVIEEITPTGSVVWSWDAAAHIAPSETGADWRSQILAKGPPYDIYHWNSAVLDTTSQADGASVVASFRHLDAVYKFQISTGNVLWKLGGTQRPGLSLTVLNDPVFAAGGDFSGQHDAQVLPDGSVTVHDNGTNGSRPARAVHYAIDEGAKTATLLSSVTDPTGVTSACCGSARLLPGGDWVASWGYTPIVTELDATGKRVFGITFTTPGQYSFRAIPVLPGVVSAASLRAAMDVQYPR